MNRDVSRKSGSRGEIDVRKKKMPYRVEACGGGLSPLPWQGAVVAQVWLPARRGGGAGGGQEGGGSPARGGGGGGGGRGGEESGVRALFTSLSPSTYSRLPLQLDAVSCYMGGVHCSLHEEWIEISCKCQKK